MSGSELLWEQILPSVTTDMPLANLTKKGREQSLTSTVCLSSMNESFSSEESDSGANCSLFLAEIVETD